MNALIVEDEVRAADKLKRMLRKLLPDAFFHGPLESVEETVAWLKSNPKPDLIFMDIHLADGHSFEIFEKIKVVTPIIFTTAYDDYAIKAFKVNSIDYLLKPIDREALKVAIEKFKSQVERTPNPVNYQSLALNVQNHYKTRFVARIGSQLQTIETRDVAFAHIWEKGDRKSVV